ncbi:transmembrane anti-sigma factor [Gigaspora margarita]|uniref:Transmembrane anti-sigma factor n=1 Tax=Gigaspora margarita TaxID=4874 RepID=A0A8H4AQM4_GIGMA|nr:transmembrane anti-sigma factor [Gigaspora margarita]
MSFRNTIPNLFFLLVFYELATMITFLTFRIATTIKSLTITDFFTAYFAILTSMDRLFPSHFILIYTELYYAIIIHFIFINPQLTLTLSILVMALLSFALFLIHPILYTIPYLFLVKYFENVALVTLTAYPKLGFCLLQCAIMRPITNCEKEVIEEWISEQGISEQGKSEQGISEQGISEQGISEQGTSEQGISEQGTSEQGISEQGISEQGISEQDHKIHFYATNIDTNHNPDFLLQHISLSENGHKLSNKPKKLNTFYELVIHLIHNWHFGKPQKKTTNLTNSSQNLLIDTTKSILKSI